jgi:DNA-directed RNA polymerase specialized sigma24 family protein
MPQFNYSVSAADRANELSVSSGAMSTNSSRAASAGHERYTLGTLVDPHYTHATVVYDNFGSVFPRPRDRLSWLCEFFGDRVRRSIQRATAGRIPRADVDDLYQEAILDCLCALEERPVAAKDYLPLLLRIAQRRGFDALRRRRRNGRTNVLEFVCFVDPRSPRPNLCSAHDGRPTPAEGRELAEILADLVAQLPPRQQQVALIYLECLDELHDHGVHQRLADALSKLTGRPENPDTIKSLWRTARLRLAVGLRRRDYDWGAE